MKIIHVDMDAFYASVEQRDRPQLRGRPVVVGGDPRSRGVVAAASYEARRFGIHSAMPCREAYRRCPQAIFVRPDMRRYVEASRAIHRVFHEVTPLVEPLSLDEAYLDVTDNLLAEPLARKVALYLKRRIREEVGLTASAGVGPSKFIAKLASDLEKPDGLVVIPPERVMAFVEALPVSKLWGVGPATARRLHALGITTALDLKRRPKADMVRALGKQGAFLWALAHGDDPRRVTPHREPKSKGAERTFAEDVLDVGVLLDVLDQQADSLASTLARIKRDARSVTLKLRYADFTTITRSVTLPTPFRDKDSIVSAASELLVTATDAGKRAARLIGVSVSGFAHEAPSRQLVLPGLGLG